MSCVKISSLGCRRDLAFCRGVAAHHAGARAHPSAWEELELLRARRHAGGAGRWLKNMSKPSTFHPRDVRRSSDKPLQQCLLPRSGSCEWSWNSITCPLVTLRAEVARKMSLPAGLAWKNFNGSKAQPNTANNIPDDQEMHLVQILLRFNNSIPLTSMTLDTIFPNIWEIQPPVFSFQRQVWAVYPAGQLLELAEAELRASLERNIDVWRRAWHLEVPIPQLWLLVAAGLTTSSDGFLDVVVSSFFTGLDISPYTYILYIIYIICCLVKAVGSVFDSSKLMQWNTMIWWVLCWLPVFLVGAGGFTLWWASSVVFTCRKPIWRSTSSSRSLNVALWYVVIWWKKTSWYMMLKSSLKPDAL